MPFIHKELALGRWYQLTLVEQLANVGSDVERTIRWRAKGNPEYAWRAFERALELLDLTLADPRWRGPRLRELARLREVLCDFLAGENEYRTTEESLRRYFYYFNYAARVNQGSGELPGS